MFLSFGALKQLCHSPCLAVVCLLAPAELCEKVMLFWCTLTVSR